MLRANDGAPVAATQEIGLSLDTRTHEVLYQSQVKHNPVARKCSYRLGNKVRIEIRKFVH